MTPSEKIKICSTCQNRKWDKDRGIVCNLTDQKPTFEFQCEHYLGDEKAVESVKQMESALGGESAKQTESGFVGIMDDTSYERRRLSVWLCSFSAFAAIICGVVGKDYFNSSVLTSCLIIWSGLTLIGTIISFFKNTSTKQTDNQISSWLFYFLWGFVAITSAIFIVIIYSFTKFPPNWLPTFATICYIALFGLMAAIGIYTIIAFHNRKPNAIALAYTYLGMIALQYISGYIVIDNKSFTFTAILLAIISIWGIYLRFSNKVNRIIPKSNRTWGLFEKIIFAIFFVMSIAYCISIYPMKAKNTNSFDIEHIEKAKQQLPVEIAEGIIWQDITVNNKTMTRTYIFKNETWTETDIKLYAKDAANHLKQEIIKDIQLELQYRYNEISNYLTDNNYSLKYICKDATEQVIFEFTITPEEYKLSLPQASNP